MLTRWNDWAFGDLDRTLTEFDVLRREMNRLFDTRSPAGLRTHTSSYPRVSLFDRGSELVVRAELPGVSEQDVDVTVDRGLLTLKGARDVEVPDGYSVHRQERGSMQFARSFTLPCQVDAE
jgi:HSP20 family protein